jgi:hypothetical protein
MRSLFSQSQTPTAPRSAVGFFRFGCPSGYPAWLITQSTSGQQGLFRCPFQPSTEANLESCSKIVNARFQCRGPEATSQERETQPIEASRLNEWEIKFFPFLHSNIHRYTKMEPTGQERRTFPVILTDA